MPKLSLHGRSQAYCGPSIAGRRNAFLARAIPGRKRMVHARFLALALATLGLGLIGCATPETAVDAPPEGAPMVAFTNLSDGDAVASPLNVCLESTNIAIEPSGEVVEGSGHHHVLVDLTVEEEASYAMPGVPIAKDVDPRLVHIGDGGTCTEIPLDAGEHTLTAVVADGGHVTLDPPVMAQVTITVE